MINCISVYSASQLTCSDFAPTFFSCQMDMWLILVNISTKLVPGDLKPFSLHYIQCSWQWTMIIKKSISSLTTTWVKNFFFTVNVTNYICTYRWSHKLLVVRLLQKVIKIEQRGAKAEKSNKGLWMLSFWQHWLITEMYCITDQCAYNVLVDLYCPE